MTLVVHPHFHSRRTGVTRHVESVVPAISKKLETRVIGSAVDPTLPRITFSELISRARKEPIIWHAHRNLEVALGVALRLVGRKVRVVFTRHAATRPSAWTRLLARAANRMVALTREVASLLGVPSTIIGHGVDPTRFYPPPDRDKAWAALDAGGRRGIGVIGRVRPDKGQGDFADAVAPLLGEHQDWTAVAVGKVAPAHRGFAEGLAKAGVKLVDEQAHVLPWYQGLSIVVQPSRHEGFSLVLLEAMAAGCCVVAARLPHYPSLVEHGRTGFLYPPGDVLALRALLDTLMRDPQLVRNVGAAAAAEARARFTVQTEADALLALYRAEL